MLSDETIKKMQEDCERLESTLKKAKDFAKEQKKEEDRLFHLKPLRRKLTAAIKELEALGYLTEETATEWLRSMKKGRLGIHEVACEMSKADSFGRYSRQGTVKENK